MAATVHNVSDDVLVHHLKLSLAALVECRVASFELFEVGLGDGEPHEIS
jgi:hypothetical protein